MKNGNYTNFLNTAENLDYVVPYPEPLLYGTGYMSGNERAEFFTWYEEEKDKIFCNKEELFAYSMGDVQLGICL